MTRILFVFILSLLPGICLAQQKAQHRQLDSIFSMLCAQNQFTGSVLIAEKGKVIFEKGYGYSNETSKERNNPQTIFELASSTKQFTAAAIVLLKRQGKLHYEDKLSRYLPELAFWDKVTIYELLRHTGGLPQYIGDMNEHWDKTKIATNEDLIRFYAARKDTLLFEPHSRHQYNNTGYALLASIIERVSGSSYADFLAEHIFKPLQMTRTFVYNRRLQPRSLKNYATGYVMATGAFDRVTSEDPRYADSMVYFLDGIVGPAKVNSTVEDVYKWITALKENTLLTQAEFDEMTAATTTSKGESIPYGFGLDLVKKEDRFSFGHTGNWDGYISLISHNVTKDRTIIILENFKMGVFPYDNITQILDNKPLELKFRRKIALPEADMKQYAGVYPDSTDKQEEHILTCLDGHLIYNAKSYAWNMRFFPVSANEFEALRPNGAGGTLRFTRLDNGGLRLDMLQDGAVIGSGIRKR